MLRFQSPGSYFEGTGTSGYDLTRTSNETLTLTATSTTIGTEIGDTTAVAIAGENTSGTNTIDIPIILAPTAGTNSTISQAAGRTLVVNGVISGSGISLTKIGDGTLTLSGAKLFTGGVTINAGTVKAGSTTALGPAANATLTFSSNSTGKFQLNGFDTTVIHLNTLGATGAIIENGASSAATLTLNSTGPNADSFEGILQNGAAGTLSLTKSGTNMLLLLNKNTYTGNTTVNEGELEFLRGTPNIGGRADSSTILLGGATTGATLSMGDDTGGNTLLSPLIVQAGTGTRILASYATSNSNHLWRRHHDECRPDTAIGHGWHTRASERHPCSEQQRAHDRR